MPEFTADMSAIPREGALTKKTGTYPKNRGVETVSISRNRTVRAKVQEPSCYENAVRSRIVL